MFDQLEAIAKKRGYENRSEFIRDMVRDLLVKGECDKDEEVLGTITLLYDHHRRQLSEKLIELQHQHHTAVLVTTQLHLTHDLCAEVGMMRDAGQDRGCSGRSFIVFVHEVRLKNAA